MFSLCPSVCASCVRTPATDLLSTFSGYTITARKADDDSRILWGEMTSQNLWSRYVRHFVDITWHNVRS